MKKLNKILLPLGLFFISPAHSTDSDSKVNPQITDSVAAQGDAEVAKSKALAINTPSAKASLESKLTDEKALPPQAINEQENIQQAAPKVAQALIANTDVADKTEPDVPLADNPLPDAQELLQFIDSLRGYQDQSFTFDLSNISFKGNEQKNRNKLAVKVLSDASLVEFTAPARSKGRKILKQAQNMWIRFPGTRNVLRISPAQRLLGEASNGDVTGTNFSQDYSASYQGREMLDDKAVIKLKLEAKHDKTTYKQVMFFLDSENQLPIRSDFYARSGKLAKQAYYTMFKEFDGDLKLHRMKLVDPIMAGSYTWMMFDNYQKQDLDSAIFHKDALTR